MRPLTHEEVRDFRRAIDRRLSEADLDRAILRDAASDYRRNRIPRIPAGCDQPGRMQPAEACTEIGADDDSALSVWRLEQRARRGDALSVPELLVTAMNSQDSGLVMSCLHRLRGKFRDAREPAVLARVVDEVLGVAQ